MWYCQKRRENSGFLPTNDVSETGQRAAQRLARRLRQEGRNVRVRIPSTAGQDWLDVLNQSTTNQPEAAAA